MRSADRLAHSLYGKYRAGPSPTNLSPAVWHRTTRLSSALADLRFLHGDQLAPQSEGRHQIEVHPPAAAVQLFLLAHIVRYRRGTIAERKEGLRLLRGLMLDHFPRLFPKLTLTELPEVPIARPGFESDGASPGFADERLRGGALVVLGPGAQRRAGGRRQRIHRGAAAPHSRPEAGGFARGVEEPGAAGNGRGRAAGRASSMRGCGKPIRRAWRSPMP